MAAALRFLIDHFRDLLDINLTASIVIVFVICVRQLLKRAPKIFSYALWGIVLLRLLVPVSIESPVSVIPEKTEFSGMVEVNEVLPEIEFETPRDRVDNEWHRENTAPGEPLVQTYRTMDAETYLTFIWLIGMAVMLLRSMVSYWEVRKKLNVVVPLRKGIFLADDIDTPFVMGLFQPGIYLPGTLDPAERKYIIAHERHHIRRGDHIFKALGYLALTIHWFNPLVWAAFILAGRDMEMSCDEAVIRRLGEDIRAEYSASLLNLATGHRMFAGTPLAFGEGNPTGRVRNLAKWKKPKAWIITVCAIGCMVLAVCLLTNPNKENNNGIDTYEQYYVTDEQGIVASGTAPEGSSDAIIAVKFKRSSGLATMNVGLQYKSEADSAWTSLASQNLDPAETCAFRVPAGCSYNITASPVSGQSGYATFEISDRGVLALAEVDKSKVTQIKLQNAHNGQNTFIEDSSAIVEICDYLSSIYGVDYGSARGYYEGTYGVTLQFGDGSEDYCVVFGDSTSFYMGEGEDGYPIRYEMLSRDIQDVVAFFSQYDSGNFQWDILGQPEAPEQTEESSAFGVTMTARDQTQSSAELVFTLNHTEEVGTVWFGETCHIFHWDNNRWTELAAAEERPPEPAAVEHLTQITPGQPVYQTIDWYERYGNLPAGKYRIQMMITLQKEGEFPESKPVFAEFSLADYQNWAVSTQVHEVTPESLVLTYHNELDDPIWRLPGYTIQRWQNGQWNELDVGKTWHETTEQVDFNHQSNPQNGMFIQWDGIGSLPEGQYLIGQEFCTASDLTKGQRFTVYASFEITGESGGIKPLDALPERYSGEQAAIDGCLVSRDGEAMDNIEAFREFVGACNRGEAGFFHIVDWYYVENSQFFVRDVYFDGRKYTVNWIEDGQMISREYAYLRHFTGEKERENMAYDAYEHYVLVNDQDATWQQIYDGLVSSQFGAAIDHTTLFSDYIYYPKHPDLPDNPDFAMLEFKGSGLVTIIDGERLEKLIYLFENAELLGYEPKTHSIGVDLNLIFTIRDQDFLIELDPDSDLCRINGEYVWYGKADEPDYILKLWEYLGITQWPDIVYTVCENALKP